MTHKHFISFLLFVTLLLINVVYLQQQNNLPFIGLQINEHYQKYQQRSFSSGKSTRGVKGKLQPIILVPGLGGSRLQATKKDVSDEPHWWCKKSAGQYGIWIQFSEMIPYVSLDCFLHDFEPHYNATTRSITSTRGVTIEPVNFGTVDSVSYLVGDLKDRSQYMSPFISYLEQNGYKADLSIRAAAFDFRMGLKEYSAPGGYFSQFKALIEDTFEKNDQARVHLLGHSMGGPMINLFLVTYVSQEWKDKYIQSMISLGGPFSGAPITAPLMFTGTNYGIPTVSNNAFIPIVRQSGGSTMMLARLSDPLIVSSKGNYTADQLSKFFRDIGDDSCASLIDREMPQAMNIAPNVPVNCLYGRGYPTPSLFEITDFKKPNFTIIGFSEGDQTVPYTSLSECDKFAEQQNPVKYPVNVYPFYKNATHTEMIFNPTIWEKVLDILTRG